MLPWLRKKLTQPAARKETDARSEAAAQAVLPAHLRLGREGEDAAASLLTDKGYVIMARNWRQGRLELDLICRHEGTLVFVEVKTRRSAAYGGPAGGLTPAKQRHLCRAAAAWLTENDAWDQPCRFDVVLILRAGNSIRAEHYCHAFDVSPSLDHSHTAWQPW